jgi:chromosome segregation ATPase
MFRYSSPQSSSFGSAIPINVTDEHNRLLTQRPATVEEANGFQTAPTMHPDASQTGATVDIRMWPLAQILVALLDLQRTSPRAAELYQTLIESETEIAQLLSEIREAAIVELKAQHERVLGECRRTLREIARLESELPPLEDLLRRRKSQTSPLRAAVAGIRAAEPKIGYPHYATPAQIEKWKVAVAEAQAALSEAESAEAAVVAQYNEIVNQIKPQKELLNGHRANIAAVNDFDRPGLVEQEERLRAQIEGREWADRSTGLKSTPAILT